MSGRRSQQGAVAGRVSIQQDRRRLLTALALLGPLGMAREARAATPWPETPAAHAPAARVHAWVMASGDHRRRPFAIVDKRAARLWLFAGGGSLLAATPALLGSAPGDDATPGVGDRPVAALKPEERTTPAGRFDCEPGRNLDGEHIVWLDYDAALAIHRLRPGRAEAHRARCLASPTPADNRASAGCVVVPVAFYEDCIRPTLGARPGVVYVLPEQLALERVFPGLAGV